MRTVLRSRTASVPPASVWALLDRSAGGPTVPERPRADLRVMQAAPERQVALAGTVAGVPTTLSVDLQPASAGRTEIEVRLQPQGVRGLCARPLLSLWAAAFLRRLVREAADVPWSAGIEPDELAG